MICKKHPSYILTKSRKKKCTKLLAYRARPARRRQKRKQKKKKPAAAKTRAGRACGRRTRRQHLNKNTARNIPHLF